MVYPIERTPWPPKPEKIVLISMAPLSRRPGETRTAITSSTHVHASRALIFQLVGQGDRISTMEKPVFFNWCSKDLRDGLLCLEDRRGLVDRHPLQVGRPREDREHLAHLHGMPFLPDALPRGDVVVTWSMRVVGAIWPPVMP